MAKIYGNTVGASSLPKSFVLETEDGAQFVGVLVGEEAVFTATDNDVREGSVYAGDKGLSTGTKVIPSYNTFEGVKIVTAGEPFSIKSNYYDYTKLQAIICDYNSNLADSVSAEQVVINNNVYNVQSVESIVEVTKDDAESTINFGITNETTTPKITRYFYYKEIY